jgi:hypothetical protein
MASVGAPIPVKRSSSFLLLAVALLAQAQPPPGGGRGARGRGGPPQSPKAAAPIDLTGYWVSVVTEDWRYRMVIPPKGAFGGLPLNQEGRRLANTWEPPPGPNAPLPCADYGAAAVMRIPGRLHITWDNDTTLKIETDAGKQTRLFHFGGPQTPAAPSLQGDSAAQWEPAGAGRGQPRSGDLKVVTTQLLPGYLRTNGVPYSANAALTEYYDRLQGPNGDDWLVVMTEVRDPQYLTMPFVTTTHFKKLRDASGWSPLACAN